MKLPKWIPAEKNPLPAATHNSSDLTSANLSHLITDSIRVYCFWCSREENRDFSMHVREEQREGEQERGRGERDGEINGGKEREQEEEGEGERRWDDLPARRTEKRLADGARMVRALRNIAPMIRPGIA